MLTGFGGEQVRHYVGLLGDSPACLIAVIVTARDDLAIAARHHREPRGRACRWRLACISSAP